MRTAAVPDKGIPAYEYTVTQLDAYSGIRVLAMLTQLLAGDHNTPLDKALKLDPKGNMQATWFDIAQQIATNVTGDRLIAISDLYAAHTTYRPVGPGAADIDRDLANTFAAHFRGRLLDWISWLAFGLKHDLADFFGGAQAIASSLQSAPEAPAKRST